jgi:RNA polymerase sigma-54 factor
MVSIAKQLGLNESTVSRAIQDKFILSPFGIISLKSLFASPVNTSRDNSISSSATVQEKIKEFIRLEDKTHPLSDQKIAVKLQQSNIAIARRTVAKYREELNIPSMVKRKIYGE